MSTFHVVVIGAGPGGLCLAQGLKKRGISVAVYEKDLARTDYLQGFRLQIRSRGIEALQSALPAELYQAFSDTYARAPDEYALVSEQLQLLPREIVDPDQENSEKAKSVSRITLRQILLSGLDDVLHFGKTYLSYEERDDGKVIAHFSDGSSVVADVLVGADGASSRIRRQLLPHARWIDTGARRLAGKIELSEENKRLLPELFYKKTVSLQSASGYNVFFTSHLFEPGHEALGPIGGNDAAAEQHAGLLFDNGKSYLMWALSGLGEQLPPDDTLFTLDGGQLRDFVLGIASQWHGAYRSVFALTDASTIGVLPIRSSLPVAPWPTRAVTLLGDAIHSMTYFRALGANTALADAALLARRIADHLAGDGDLIGTLAGYEAVMLETGFDAVRKSLAAFERGHGAAAQSDWADVDPGRKGGHWLQSHKKSPLAAAV